MKHMILVCMTFKFEFFWVFFTCWNSELTSPPNEIPYLVNTSVASAKAQYVQRVIVPYIVSFGWVNSLHLVQEIFFGCPEVVPQLRTIVVETTADVHIFCD